MCAQGHASSHTRAADSRELQLPGLLWLSVVVVLLLLILLLLVVLLLPLLLASVLLVECRVNLWFHISAHLQQRQLPLVACTSSCWGCS